MFLGPYLVNSGIEYQLVGLSGDSLDNAVQDGLQFSYVLRSGDGEFISKALTFGSNQGGLTFAGPMVFIFIIFYI